MSFIDLAGQKVDVTSLQHKVLNEAEKAYAAGKKTRLRHVVIWKLHQGYDWNFTQIGLVLGLNRGHVCRIARRMDSLLAKLSREIFASVAREPICDE